MPTRAMSFEALLPSTGERVETLQPMDEEAFRGFYERNARPVRAYLARLTGSLQLADDLLQEAFYRFVRAGAAHESESHRRNSLYRIATNLARDHARSGKRGTIVPLEENSGSDAGTARRAEARTDLARAMSHLKEGDRELLWLAYGQGSSHEEIAEALGLNRGSVKQLLFRARRKLAVLLGADGRAR